MKIKKNETVVKLKLVVISTTVTLLFSCSFLVNTMSFQPDKTIWINENELPENVSLKKIKTKDGITIDSLYFKNPKSKKVILYFHGNAGNMYSRVFACKKIVKLNYNLLLISYRGYAGSQGSPSEAGIYQDAEAAYNYLLNELNYKSENITIFGRSIGSAVAINLAQHKNIDKLILVTPLLSGKDFADAHGGGCMKTIAGDSFNSKSKLDNIICPILFIHGDQDRIIPYSHGKKLFNLYKERKKFITIYNGDHNNLEFIDPDIYWQSITNFLK